MTPAARTLRGLATVTASAIVGGLLAVAPSAVAAEVAVIPQAPVLSVIAATETLPFTVADEGTIEIAVLTDGEDVESAAWTTSDELALAPYAGQTIRVLARKQGVTDMADTFDATYDVRDSFAPANGLGTETNPTTAIAANSSIFKSWASGITNFTLGTGVSDAWVAANEKQGALGEVPFSDDTVNGATSGLMVLGNNGQITVSFNSPIVDEEGTDFAVFENGLRINGSNGLDFSELAYIEVSTDGEHFVQFDTANRSDSPVGQYGGLSASNYGGVAGLNTTGWGVGFDLATLQNKPEVRSGQVDLDEINYVKVRDIEGCGDELDSWGRPIYDPCGTGGSGGFDLMGVGVINQADDMGWLNPVVTSNLTATSVTATTAVTGNGHEMVLHWELADDATGLNARTVGTTSTTKKTNVRINYAKNLTGLTKKTTYWVRVVGDPTDGSPQVVTGWRKFTTPTIAMSMSEIWADSILWTADGKASSRLSGRALLTDNDQELFFEYATTAEKSDIEETEHFVKTKSDSAWVDYVVTGLSRNYTYWARYVAIDLVDGSRSESDWIQWTTYRAPKLTPSVSSIKRTGDTASANLGASIGSGTLGAFDVSVEYTSNADHSDAIALNCGSTEDIQNVTQGAGCLVEGLDLNSTYYYRVIAANPHITLESGWLSFSTAIATTVTLASEVRIGSNWLVNVETTSGALTRNHQVSLEVREASTSGSVVKTMTRTVSGANLTNALTFNIDDLDPTVRYYVRATVLSEGATIKQSSWINTAGVVEPAFRAGYPSVAPQTDWTSIAVNPGLDVGTYGNHTLVAEITEDVESGAIRTEPVTGYTKFDGFETNHTYWVRLVATSTHYLANARTTVSDWQQVSMVPILTAPSLRMDSAYRFGALSLNTLTVTYNDADTVGLEFRLVEGTGAATATATPVATATRTLTKSGSATDTFTLSFDGLDTSTDTATRKTYQLWAIVTADGQVTSNSPVTVGYVRYPVAPTVNAPTVTPQGVTTAVSVGFNSGYTGPQSVVLELSDSADGEVVSTFTTSGTSSSVTGQLTGLLPGTKYWVRAVLTATHPLANGLTTTSGWTEFVTPALNDALTDVAISGLTRTSAVVSGVVRPGMYDRQLVAEVAPVDGGTTIRTDAVAVAGHQIAATRSIEVTGLQPGTSYRARFVSSVAGVDDETTQWVEFDTPVQSASLGDATVSGVAPRSASVSVPVIAGDLAQRVRVEYADPTAVSGSTTEQDLPAGTEPVTMTFDLTGLQANTAYTYRVVSTPVGDGSPVTSAWSQFTTATLADPSVEVSVSPASARVGETVTVTWTTSEATGLVATGSWSGAKALQGSEQVEITEAGTWTFGLTATGEAGNSSSAAAVLTASLPAASLRVSTQKSVSVAGKKVKVTASGLASGEDYAISIAGTAVATGTVGQTGALSRKVKVPADLGAGTVSVVVTGSVADRVGSGSITLVAKKATFAVKAPASVKRGTAFKVRVTGLGAFESATIRTAGSTTTVVANAKGVATTSLKAQTKKGAQKVKVVGLTKKRKGAATVRVK